MKSSEKTVINNRKIMNGERVVFNKKEDFSSKNDINDNNPAPPATKQLKTALVLSPKVD